MSKRKDDLLAIGEVSRRSGIATSAIRFYEGEGLVRSERTAANHRVFGRHVLRRLAVIRAAQQVGLTLDETATALDALPPDRAPTKAEWARLSRTWRGRLDDRIAELERLRDTLTSCIGCGCLSLTTCRLYNPDDAASTVGDGPRFLLGDDPELFWRRDGLDLRASAWQHRAMIEVTCMCGYQARGTEDEVVALLQSHGLADHGKASSREQIIAMSVPIDPESGG